jgi:Zyg-11 family protein
MSVAICSILAAKISTSETTVLGSTPKYMRKLLAMVRAKMESNMVDITLKFTLSALWNLTGMVPSFAFFPQNSYYSNLILGTLDESPETCSIFLREGGLELFLQVLEAFPGESTVETKVNSYAAWFVI